MKLAGKLCISRPNYPDDRKVISIRLQDQSSGLFLAEVEISAEAFALATTGLGHQDCLFEGKVENWQRAGWRQEFKKEVLPRPDWYQHETAKTDALLEAYELDGWVADRNDLFNHHCWSGENQVSVGFRRYVPPQEIKGT